MVAELCTGWGRKTVSLGSVVRKLVVCGADALGCSGGGLCLHVTLL